jgi:hypothetical protein
MIPDLTNIFSNSDVAPWIIIKSDNKKSARLNCIRYILSNVHYHNKIEDKEFFNRIFYVNAYEYTLCTG